MMRVATETEISAVLAHPRFLEARNLYVKSYLEIYSGEPTLNKLLAESARHVIITFIICIAAASQDDQPDTWLTLSKLQDAVSENQVGSPGLVEAIVARMLDRGLLDSRAPASDRRKRILVPTAELLKHDRDIIVAQAVPTAMVCPSHSIDQAVACEPAFQRKFRAVSVEAFGAAMTMLMRHSQIMLFYARDSGQMILFSLLANALAGGGNLSTVPYREMTDRFGISRTHARDVINAAEGEGLVRTLEPGGAAVEIQPALWEAVHRFMADAMLLFAFCAEAADR
ncbi:MAG: hypothetical protein JO254_14030 [Pseudolabrys sp.]|nr:hypothetical protein [Pseudolabrys sp.]